ncbi:MAG: outer membrane beta-barrel protein [Hyphomicrobiales bacterium]|nr:outer membrane beta-barrel protein [Hyphomicrobiales bacterium]
MTKLEPWRIGLAAAVLMTSAVSTVNAADVYKREEAVSFKDEPTAPPIAWGGFYIGANLGGNFTDDFFGNGRRAFDADGQILGGLHAGYNLQRSTPLVLGLETDVNFSEDIEYLSTIRARLGYAVGNVLFYGTGGVAFASFDDKIFEDDTETGYVFGGGVEGKVRQNMSLGLEGLYHQFEDVGVRGGGETDIDFWSVRARATFHVN